MENKKQENLNFNNVSEIEILSKRGKREKHYLQKDGTIIARMYSDNIHFKENDKYIEIDNRLEKIQNYYKNKRNSFNVYFKEFSSNRYMNYEISGETIGFELINSNQVPITIVNSESQYCQEVKYNEILKDIDFEYHINPTKIKENIVINNENSLLDQINFKIYTDLNLVMHNKGINVIKNEKILFTFEAPFIIDSNNQVADCVYYILEKEKDGYHLLLKLDVAKLKTLDLKFPIMIDPTISTSNTDVYDTFIYWSPIVSSYTTTGGALYDFDSNSFLASDIVSKGGVGTYKLSTSYSVDPITTEVTHVAQVTTPIGEKYNVGSNEGFVKVYYPNKEGEVWNDNIVVEHKSPYEDNPTVSNYTTSGGAICEFDSSVFAKSNIVSFGGVGVYTVKTNISIDSETTAVTYIAKVITPNGKIYDAESEYGFYKLYFPDDEESTNTDTITIVNNGSYSDRKRSLMDCLKVGVEKQDNYFVRNRALIKFDLPTIGTGSQVCSAILSMTGYRYYDDWYVGNLDGHYIDVHQVTENWNEETANWATMNDKYKSKIEDSTYFIKGTLGSGDDAFYGHTDLDITSLVKRWYLNEPNYGVLLKSHNEKYIDSNFPKFYSKNNNVFGDNPKPTLLITYRNQNGIENYMDYKQQDFAFGTVYENSYNGNITGVFSIGETVGSKLPTQLEIVYNTNDVILGNNIGYGLGYKLNVWQTIEKVEVDKKEYLEFMDQDGTIHYFKKDNNIYIEEDNQDMTVSIENNSYILKDKDGNKSVFEIRNDIGYIKEYVDTDNNTMKLFYNNDNKIIKLVDENEKEINFTYEANKIDIISPDRMVTLNYVDGVLTKIISSNGDIIFSYNENRCLKFIKDTNNTKVGFVYYEQLPYRIKDVTEYGIDNSLGTSLHFDYSFNATTIIDNEERAKTTCYNDFGMVTSTSNLKDRDNINNAYAFVNRHIKDTENKNKWLISQIPIKYVKNYLSNTSFEEETINFTLDDEEGNLSFSESNSRSGGRSLFVKTNSPNKSISQDISVSDGKYYTFSVYAKHSNNIKLSLGYNDFNGEFVENVSKEFVPTDDFRRYDISIYYPSNAISNLLLKINLITSGDLYLDDIQLEEGEVANDYNYISNSDFSEGLDGWDTNSGDSQNRFEVVSLEKGGTALKIKMDPIIETSLSKTFNIKGKKGDSINLSFWYKNMGVALPSGYNIVMIIPKYITDDPYDNHPEVNLVPNDNVWQYFSLNFITQYDYNGIEIFFMQNGDSNNLYLTNLSLFKEVPENIIQYDEVGNIISMTNYNKQTTYYNYDKNNQLIEVIDPNKTKSRFEYSNSNVEQLLNGISHDGVINEIKYDDNHNPIVTRIQRKNNLFLSNKELYSIRSKGTNFYIRDILGIVQLIKSNDINEKWLIENYNEYFTIKHSIINKYLSCNNLSLTLSVTCTDNSKFEFIENKNGSYLIKIKNMDKYLKNNNGILEFANLVENDYSYEFYFENNNNEFLENYTTYNKSGTFVEKETDTNLKSIYYDIDDNTGLLKSIIDSNGIKISYDYDEQNRLIKAATGTREINYSYNIYNLLKEIIQGRRKIFFEYDDFLNLKTTKIGNNVIVTNNYNPRNGNLSSVLYANGQKNEYVYDCFNRIDKEIKEDDTYNYKYGNNGDLRKVVSNNHIEQFEYDLNKRLKDYLFDNFEAQFQYDNSNNLISELYGIDVCSEDDFEKIINEFDNDNSITKTIFDSNFISYRHDNIGRVIGSFINDNINTTIEYVTNGKRTTTLIKNLFTQLGEYSYKYDNLGNITHIYHNDLLKNKYFYNCYNELIKEYDYVNNRKIVYTYDEHSNMVSKQYYKLDDFSIEKQETFKYTNGDWIDQLSYYNDQKIDYDGLGNIISIGDYNLSWINGRQLKQITNLNDCYSYKYSKEGFRISKTINNVETKYYLNNNDIVFEKTGNNVIYYIRNNVDGLIGLKYNDELFYYIKNNSDDIIGIMDAEYNVVASYQYDSWGNILSIVDGNNVDITNNENHIANINPFRYRSYYYDKETKLYYLNSRYYCPRLCRFISADNNIIQNYSLNGSNMYIYAENNPINKIDINGNKSLLSIINSVIKKVKKVISKIVSKPKKKPKKKTSSKNEGKTCPVTTPKKSSSNSLPAKSNPNSLPTKSKPNSTLTRKDGQQKRDYGPDGRAVKDTDYEGKRHPNLDVPHYHGWEWDENDIPHRSPAYDDNHPLPTDDAAKIALGVTAGYLIYRCVRLIPSLLPPLWPTIPANVAIP